MYNLLVSADEKAWDTPYYYEYDRSRFLEYTNDSIAKTFQYLTEENIEALKSYPCIFAYENTDLDVRIGTLKSIKERNRTIWIEFEFYEDIPPIPFYEIKPLAPYLDIRDWEMSRTHWAVKDEDLLDRLQSILDLSHEERQDLYDEKGQIIVQHSETKRSTVTTVRGFISAVLGNQEEIEKREIFYRGHSDKGGYKLEPSLFRKDKEGNYLYLNKEHILYRELIVLNSADFALDEYTLDKLVRMQHYSLPTRLLDITSNPLISLYFACISKVEEDGEVIFFSVLRDQVKYFDSDTVSCLSNLSRLPKTEKDNIDFDLQKEEFNSQTPITRLIHLIREEKSFFESKIIPNDLRKVICVKSKKSNDRISSQSGAFLLFGIDSVLDERGTSDIIITRVTVGKKSKASILRELDLLNINESTVFPYIENSAKYVGQKYKFSKPHS